MDGWRTIDTAPHQEPVVIGHWCEKRRFWRYIMIAEYNWSIMRGFGADPRAKGWIVDVRTFFNEGLHKMVQAGGYLKDEFPPTHWMPLPGDPSCSVPRL
jgi:hypothetical protein